jgi:hypothetical protein
VTDWGQSRSLVYELRREITRLRQANARLQTDRTESRAGLARVADSLEREARRLPVHWIEPVSRRDLRLARAVEPPLALGFRPRGTRL